MTTLLLPRDSYYAHTVQMECSQICWALVSRHHEGEKNRGSGGACSIHTSSATPPIMLPSFANSVANAVTDMLNESQERRKVKQDLRNEIGRIQRERATANKAHTARVNRTRQRMNLLHHQIEQVRAQELPVHRYASELKDSDTPSHILLLQAQVCRAVHFMSVDSVQLQVMKKLEKQLHNLVREQQRQQLKNLLWMVEARTELRQQQEDDIYHDESLNHVDEQSPNTIDDLVKSINKMKLNKAVSPNISMDEWENVTKIDDVDIETNYEEMDHDFDLLFMDDHEEEEDFHKSLPTLNEGRIELKEKKRRASSLIQHGTWNSEKPQSAW